MVEETIRTIKETENQADEIVKSAQEKSRTILEEAREEADRQKKEILQNASERAKEMGEAVRAKGLQAE